MLAEAGFREIAWNDVTAASLAWARERVAAIGAASAPSPLGPHLVLGPDAREKGANVVRNLEEGRIEVIQSVFERR